ncbi:MAG: filamentous hemagglutinin N-terminal domain-containing protein, partial [Okeania sp. SIO2H7]|nr:filamentous hemagglutinin N-terminal domain-containing protein [Okeania sp. SIO2H7]
MKKTKDILLSLLPLACCLLPAAANAQIVPDRTLPNNTILAPNGQIINIEGGTRSGGNLFHSFQEFNLS